MKWLSEHLGQSFIVENRPGAGSNLATEMVVRAPPDGYTLLEISASNAWNATLYDNLNFNFIRDIVPIAGVRRAGGVMEVNHSVPVTTVSEFIAYAKANPGKINMATIRRRLMRPKLPRVRRHSAALQAGTGCRALRREPKWVGPRQRPLSS
jgi:tripartite-type tricarboxylate transporter receptor subunit TctC